jgi:hypothetical protein
VNISLFFFEVVGLIICRRTYRMCRDILNTCVRNTEEAEKASLAHVAAASVSATAASSATANSNENAIPSSGRGHGKGVWGMLEESRLAQTIRRDEEKLVRSYSSHPISLSCMVCRSTRISYSKPGLASMI